MFPPFGAGVCRATRQKRSWRRNKRGHPCRGPPSQHPSSITEIPAGAFKECNWVVTVAIPESVTLRLKIASLKSMTIPKPVTCNRELVTDLEIVRCLCTLQGVGEHDYPQVSDVHWRFDVRQSFGNSYGFETATSKGQVLAKDRHSRKRRKCAIDDKLQATSNCVCCNCLSLIISISFFKFWIGFRKRSNAVEAIHFSILSNWRAKKRAMIPTENLQFGSRCAPCSSSTCQFLTLHWNCRWSSISLRCCCRPHRACHFAHPLWCHDLRTWRHDLRILV